MLFNFVSTTYFLLAFYLLGIEALPATTTVFGDEVALHLRGKRSSVEVDGVEHPIWDHDATHAKIGFVTNSGVCEMTRGVSQYSGFVDVGSKYSESHNQKSVEVETLTRRGSREVVDFAKMLVDNQSMWLWFFEARN